MADFRAATALRFVAFAAAASMLVVSFDVTAIGVLGALALHKAIVSRSAEERLDRRFWMAWGVAFLLLIVWLAMSFTAPSRQSHSGFTVLINRFRYGSPYYFGQFNAHVFPASRAVDARLALGDVAPFPTLENVSLTGVLPSFFRWWR